MTSPLKQLLQKVIGFSWDETCEKAFLQIKSVITQNLGPILTCFDPFKEVTLQVDASKYGLGAALLQNDRPASFTPKSLTPTEKQYSHIEKELFNILFGCTRFHPYVYKRRIIVQTGHKLVLAIIFKKDLHLAPPRLQRILFSLTRYDINLTYIPGM